MPASLLSPLPGESGHDRPTPPEPREVELVHPGCQPSKTEMGESIEFPEGGHTERVGVDRHSADEGALHPAPEALVFHGYTAGPVKPGDGFPEAMLPSPAD